MVTLENRPVFNSNYQAIGVCFSHNMIKEIFSDDKSKTESIGIQILHNFTGQLPKILKNIQTTAKDKVLPNPIKHHRFLEPLIWLKYYGIRLSFYEDEKPLSKIRRLVETDLSRPWRSSEVAEHFAISESTMRRWLARSGQGFAKILQSTRLEHGLSLLQSTDIPISVIAINCGFKTPSHFSDAFRKRFGIKPSEIRKVEN